MEDKILGHLRNLTKIKSIPFPPPPPQKKKDEFCVLCKFYRDVVTIFFEGGGEGDGKFLFISLNWQKVVFCNIFGYRICCQYLSHGGLMFVMNILWF